MLFDFREAHSVAITGPVAVQVPGSRRQATQLFDSARQQAADLDVITEGDEISSGEL